METAPVTGKIAIEDFRKLELKVGKVVSAENHPNADRLLVVKVDIGGEVRQLVAGIRASYEAAAIVGKSVIVLCNLNPAMLRGVESNGMILAASAEEGEGKKVISLLRPEADLPAGSKVS